MEEDIGHLQVPVHHSHLSQVHQPLVDILDEGGSLLLSEEALPLHEHVQIAAIADLGHDVALSIVVDDLVALEHVGVADLHEDVHLHQVQLEQPLRAQRFELDHLHRHCLP